MSVHPLAVFAMKKLHPKNLYRQCVSNGQRWDGRPLQGRRAVNLTTGELGSQGESRDRICGSSTMRMGSTSVIAAVIFDIVRPGVRTGELIGSGNSGSIGEYERMCMCLALIKLIFILLLLFNVYDFMFVSSSIYIISNICIICMLYKYVFRSCALSIPLICVHITTEPNGKL